MEQNWAQERPSAKRSRSVSIEREEQGAQATRGDLPANWNITHSVPLLIGHSVPHRVVPQLLHPVLAAHIDEPQFVLATAADRALFATELSLRNGCTEAESEALWALKLPALETLSFERVEGIDTVITKLADHAPRHFPELREISMEQCLAITDAVPSALCRMPTITSLDFTCTGTCISASALAVLQKGMPQLRELELSNCRSIDARALAHVGGMAQLRALGLHAACSTSPRGGHGKGPAGRSVDAAALIKELAPLQHLERIDVGSNGAMEAEAFSEIARHTGLKCLGLGGCDGLTAEGFEALRPLTQLEELDLISSSNVDDAALYQISMNHRNLKTLLLGGSDQFTATGLAHLRQLPRLCELDLAGCVQENGAEALWHVSQVTSLKVLDVKFCDIDEIGLTHLSRLPNLDVLRVNCTTVPNAGVLLSAVPQVQMFWSGFVM